jgi:hypothetical protein
LALAHYIGLLANVPLDNSGAGYLLGANESGCIIVQRSVISNQRSAFSKDQSAISDRLGQGADVFRVGRLRRIEDRSGNPR